jgi:hypothetical protein
VTSDAMLLRAGRSPIAAKRPHRASRMLFDLHEIGLIVTQPFELRSRFLRNVLASHKPLSNVKGSESVIDLAFCTGVCGCDRFDGVIRGEDASVV